MSFKKQKVEGSGRKKGTPNKRTLNFEQMKEACERLGFNPSERLIQFAAHPDPAISFNATKEICKYTCPQLKAVELSGKPDAPVTVGLQGPWAEEFERIKSAYRKTAPEKK